MESVKILNKATDELPDNYVYIGRPSKWGNPFVVGKDGTRAEVIRKYKEYLMSNESLLKDLHELEGKTLVCWCAPRPCHGDVLRDIIENKYRESFFDL